MFSVNLTFDKTLMMQFQRRRNRRGIGAFAPAMLKPAIICQVYQLVDSQNLSLYSFFSGLIAGLQESSPEEPKMHLDVVHKDSLTLEDKKVFVLIQLDVLQNCCKSHISLVDYWNLR